MFHSTSQPKLTLIGAGPGDPDLITVKAIRAIGAARVILYDALVNKKLLGYASPSAIKIFAGKRKGQHLLSQRQINELIVQYAFSHGNVARLKGGDPFVFGRGYEEIEYARKFNIETEYIPGISSSVGVVGDAGIPVTHRGLSESFWVLTGTTRSGKLSSDIALAAKSSATAVILMGLSKLHEIVEAYKTAGKTELPVAIIQNGTLPNQKIITGTLETIEEIAREENIGAPAVIVIGEVVKLYPESVKKEILEKYLFN